MSLSEQVSEDRFVSALDEKFKCPICLECLHVPTQCPQGHVFCRSCILNVGDQRDCRCPLDRKFFLKNQLFPNLFVQNCINELLIRCKHNVTSVDITQTCNWIGPVHASERHETNDCLLRFIKCNNVGCSTSIQFRDYEVHVTQDCQFRKTTCVHCFQVVLSHASASHELICDMIPRHCPNECDDQPVIPRHHKPICPLQLVNCPLFELKCCRSSSIVTLTNSSSSGGSQPISCLPCTGLVKRRDLAFHVGSSVGLTDTVIALCEQVKDARARCETLTKELTAVRNMSGAASSLTAGRSDWNTTRPATTSASTSANASLGSSLMDRLSAQNLGRQPTLTLNERVQQQLREDPQSPSSRYRPPPHHEASWLSQPMRREPRDIGRFDQFEHATNSNSASDGNRAIHRSDGFYLSSRTIPYFHRPPTPPAPPVFASLPSAASGNSDREPTRRRTVHDLLSDDEEDEGERVEQVSVRPRIRENPPIEHTSTAMGLAQGQNSQAALQSVVNAPRTVPPVLEIDVSNVDWNDDSFNLFDTDFPQVPYTRSPEHHVTFESASESDGEDESLDDEHFQALLDGGSVGSGSVEEMDIDNALGVFM